MSQGAEETDKGKAELVRELDYKRLHFRYSTYLCVWTWDNYFFNSDINTTFTIVINDAGAKTVWSLKC